MKYSFINILILCIVVSCVSTPKEPNDEHNELQGIAALVLCEGLWGMNNSDLDAIEITSGKLANNYFEQINNFPLGDVANDIVLKGDTAFIAVSESRLIEVINVRSGKSIGRIDFGESAYPRSIYIANSHYAFVTDLYNACIRVFNPDNFIPYDIKISVGPAPEGITGTDNLVFVANSGYGDYLAKVEKAGTISVIDIEKMEEIAVIQAGPNPIELIMNKFNSRVYCIYYNLPSMADSLGGIIEYSIPDMNILRHFRCDAESATLSPNGRYLYYISKEDVHNIDLHKEKLEDKLIIINNKTTEHWYSLAISPFDGSFWIGNARNYQINGNLLIYREDNLVNPFLIYKTGVNPGKILFVE